VNELAAADAAALEKSRTRPTLTELARPTRIAFLGDQGLTPASARVLELVATSEVDLLVLLGDFDYENRPAAWLALVESSVGAVPWIAVVGNHDVPRWEGPRGYAVRVNRGAVRAPELGCSGTPGRSQSCVFRGIRFVLSDVGTLGSSAASTEELVQNLRAAHERWRVCAWHKNQREMQVGTKRDEVGWAPYRACAAAGAFVVSAHEHSYARTFTLTDLGNRLTAHGAETWASPTLLETAVRRSFVIVVGTGGHSIRPLAAERGRDPWWAAFYTRNAELVRRQRRPVDGAADPAGVLLMDFGIAEDPRRARGRFVTIGGRAVDEFEVRAP
jgi:hypothetical protein